MGWLWFLLGLWAGGTVGVLAQALVQAGGCGNGSSSWRNCPIHGTSRQRCGGAPLFFARFPLPGFHGIMIAKENHSGSSLSLTYGGAMPQFYEPGKKTENYKPDSPWPSPLGSMAKPCLGAEPSEAGRENLPPIPITSQNKSSIPSDTKKQQQAARTEKTFPAPGACVGGLYETSLPIFFPALAVAGGAAPGRWRGCPGGGVRACSPWRGWGLPCCPSRWWTRR